MVNMKPSLDTKQFVLRLDSSSGSGGGTGECIVTQVYLLNLKKSLFVWVGDHSQQFHNLSLAQFVTLVSSGDSKVYSANLMGNILDPLHQNLCRKLSCKLKMPVFLSLNVQLPPETSGTFERLLVKHVAAATSPN